MADDVHLDLDRYAGKSREELLDLFPEQREHWRCPACGASMDGKSYNLDAERKKCSKTWHTHAPVKTVYVRRDVTLGKLHDLLAEMEEEGDAATGVQRAIEVLS